MKKLMCVVLSVLLLAACFVGCSKEKTGYRVAIVQQLEHSSLDEIRTAIEAQLKTRADAKGITVTVDYYNGQNDGTMLASIGSEVVSGGVDLIIPIATFAAQSMVTASENTNIPIVFSAVSDPVGAGLTGMDRVTGTSDALNTPFVLEMMLAVKPDVKTVGLLYSTSEDNSTAAIAEAKHYLDSKNIAYVEATGVSADDIITAVQTLAGSVDAVFTPTDNTVMSVEGRVAEILCDAGIPHFAGADSFVTAGAFATCGVNYTELGTATADMAMDILLGGKVGDFRLMDGGIITVNTQTAGALGLDYSPYATMASTVVEVTTG